MRGSVLVVAWGLSLALPVSLSTLGFEPDVGLRLGWALLPWLALAGLPRRRPQAGLGVAGPSSGDRPATGLSAFLWTLALALPPLGLAAGLDAGAGRTEDLIRSGAPLGLVTAGLWSAAATLGARSARGWATVAALWFVAVPLPTAVGVALGWAVPESVGLAPGAGAPDAAGALRWLELGTLESALGWARGRPVLAFGMVPFAIALAACGAARVCASDSAGAPELQEESA